AKRSSVPYLMYWALDVGLACFRDGVSLLVDMEGDSGRGELLVSAVLENQVQIRASRREARLLLVVRSR
ncbi:hypothetical protein TNCV_3723111, partial [Trichonephila clavipes]